MPQHEMYVLISFFCWRNDTLELEEDETVDENNGDDVGKWIGGCECIEGRGKWSGEGNKGDVGRIYGFGIILDDTLELEDETDENKGDDVGKWIGRCKGIKWSAEGNKDDVGRCFGIILAFFFYLHHPIFPSISYESISSFYSKKHLFDSDFQRKSIFHSCYVGCTMLG